MAFPYGQRATATLEEYAKTFTDNIFKATPTLAWFKAKQQPYRGGNPITERLMHAKNDSGGWKGRGAVLQLAEKKFLDKATWTPATLTKTVFIPEQDVWDNMGDAAVLDLLRANTENAEMSMMEDFSAALLGSNAGQDEENLCGLLNVLTAATACGGITDGGANAWWTPYNNTTTENLARDTIATAYNSCSSAGGAGQNVGADQPDLFSTTQTLYEKLDFILAPLMRMQGTPTPQIVQMGYAGLRYLNAEITWDPNCPSGNVLILNSKWVRLRPHVNFAQKVRVKEVAPAEQLAYAAHMSWYGQLTVRQRRRLGRMTNKS